MCEEFVEGGSEIVVQEVESGIHTEKIVEGEGGINTERVSVSESSFSLCYRLLRPSPKRSE